MSSEGLPDLVHPSPFQRFVDYVTFRQPNPANAPARKRPTNLLYDVDEAPPLGVALGAAVQHIFLMSVGWLYIVVIANAVGSSTAQTLDLIRISMIASGIATILQAQRGFVGSGYLCPLTASLTFLPCSILAVRAGGFSLLFGMIAISGIAMCLLSLFLHRLRVLFPPEVTGLMISMSGLQLVALGCPRFVGYTGPGFVPDFRIVLVGVATLFAMVGATVWSRGKLHALPILVGLAVGYTVALSTRVIHFGELSGGSSVAWIDLPHRASSGMTFRSVLLAPFLIACLTATLKSVGDLTLCQKINDVNWKRTEMKSVGAGLFANGLGITISGLAGGVSQNTVSSSIGLSLASGITSRSVALPTGLGVIALAFVPKISSIFVNMPVPAMGAMLIYSACFIVLGGFQLLTSRMLDARRIFAVGIALIFGLSLEISPDMYRRVPAMLQPVFSSSSSLATMLVVLLSFLFRIGIRKSKSFELMPGDKSIEVLRGIMDEQGSLWAMRREVVARAEQAIYETMTIITLKAPSSVLIDVKLEFDELHFEAEIDYQGEGFEIARRPPAVEDIGSDESVVEMASYLIGQNADRVKVKSRGNRTRVALHFEH
jgi:xanthine permease XanP